MAAKALAGAPAPSCLAKLAGPRQRAQLWLEQRRALDGPRYRPGAGTPGGFGPPQFRCRSLDAVALELLCNLEADGLGGDDIVVTASVGLF